MLVDDYRTEARTRVQMAFRVLREARGRDPKPAELRAVLDRLRAARARHEKARAEGRLCACEGPHGFECLIEGAAGEERLARKVVA